MGGIGTASNTSVSMSGSSSVTGVVANMGVANAGNLSMSGSSLIDGTLLLNTAGRLNRSGASRIAGEVEQDTDADGVLDQAAADALVASQTAAALPATITSITNINITSPSQSVTITGSAETNVLHLTKLNITSGTLTLNAPPGGTFIINISGSFNLTGGSRIVLTGGITPCDVLYNIVGNVGNVSMTGKSALSGILLAPERQISLGPGLITGEVIAGGRQITFSGNGQVDNPGP